MKEQKIQRWEVGILICVIIFMVSTETNWWHWPLLAIPFLVLIGWVQKKEIEATKTKPTPMAKPKYTPKSNPLIWIYFWTGSLIQKIRRE